MKWLGALMVFSCCTAAGFSYAGSIAEKRRICAEMISYWKSFRQLLQTSRENPLVLIERLGESNAYSDFGFAMEMKRFAVWDHSFSDTMAHLFEQTTGDYLFLRHCLSPLEETLGCVPLETELQVLDTVLLRLEQERSYWAGKEDRQAGLSRRLGLLCGTLLMVVLL